MAVLQLSHRAVIARTPIDTPVKPAPETWPNFAAIHALAYSTYKQAFKEGRKGVPFPSQAVREASPFQVGDVVEIVQYGRTPTGEWGPNTHRYLIVEVGTTYLRNSFYSVPEYLVVGLVAGGKRWSTRGQRIYPGSFSIK